MELQQSGRLELDAVAVFERLATLETRLEGVETRLGSIDGGMSAMDLDIRALREALTKQRGFIAGFSAAFALLGSLVTGLVLYWLERADG